MRAATLALLVILAARAPRSWSGSLRGTASKAVPDTTTIALAEQSIDLPRAAELRAVVSAQCGECAWDTEGREAVTLTIWVDGVYSQHLPLVRGGSADYSVMLGSADAGTPHHPPRHRSSDDGVRAQRDGAATARLAVTPLFPDAPEHLALALAPFVYARPNTVGRFTDVPVFMWYEREPTERGARYRYSVIFTNEDGGTPTDRLMATWGRTTDIEYIYSVEVDRAGGIVAEDYQGPEHEVLAFRGRREGRHPLLWVATDNNMVRDAGDVAVRYAPAPQAADLADVSREAVMDANPWLYAVMAQELRREGKIADNAPPGQDKIPDPRRFVYVEACGNVGNAALAFAVNVRRQLDLLRPRRAPVPHRPRRLFPRRDSAAARARVRVTSARCACTPSLGRPPKESRRPPPARCA